MTAPKEDPGHLLPADEWARVKAEAEAHAAALAAEGESDDAGSATPGTPAS